MKKNKLAEIKIETPIEQHDEPIPTEEWYYIPFTKNMGIESNYWYVATIGTGDPRIKQTAIDCLNNLHWIKAEDKKIVKIRMLIPLPEPPSN